MLLVIGKPPPNSGGFFCPFCQRHYPEHSSMKMDTLLHFSGGIDSTHVLYHYLLTNPDKHLLVHHINLISDENRNEAERRSVAKILQWLKDNGLSNFKYIESTFDYGSIEGKVLDGMIVAFFTGVFTAIYPELFYTFSCTPKDELQRLGEKIMWRRARYGEISGAIYRARKLAVKRPLIHLSKSEIIAQLPPDLFALTWYCRSPIYQDEEILTCGKCHTCKQVREGHNIGE